jgi:2-phosphoglycerate kinase
MHAQNLDRRMDWIRSYQMVITMMKGVGVDDITMCYIKRFLAYHSMNAARIAYQQKDSRLMKCQSIMRTYQAEYEETNQQYPERVRQFRDIMQIMQ